MSAQYCVQCYIDDGRGITIAPYLYNGKSLCNIHLWKEVEGKGEETSVEYELDWMVLVSDGEWLRHRDSFFGDLSRAEEKYDEIARLEKTFGTPKSPQLRRREIRTTSWKEIERHA